MATSIGEIVVEMVANTARFRTDLERSSQLAKKASKDIDQAISAGMKGATASTTGLLSSLTLFRGLLPAIGLVAFGRSALNAASQINDMADRLGVGVESLQALSHAARATGAGVEDLDVGLKNLGRHLSEAAAGEAAAVKLFGGLGIAVTDTAGNIRGAEDVLGEFADKMQSTASAAQRLQIVTDVFGKSGARLIPMLKDGRAGLEAMRSEAQLLGGVVNAQTIKVVDDLGDAFGALAAALNGAAIQALGAAAQQINALVGIATLGVATFKRSLEELGPDKLAGSAILGNRLADALRNLADAEKEMANAGEGRRYGPTPDMLKPTVEIMRRRVAELKGLHETRVKDEQAALKPPPSAPPKLPPGYFDAFESFRSKLTDLAADEDPVTKALLGIGREVERLKTTYPKLTKEIDATAAGLRALITTGPLVEKSFAAALDKIEAGTITIREVTRTTNAGVAEELAAMGVSFAGMAEDVNISATGVTRSIKDMAAEQSKFADAFGGEIPTDSLDNLIKRLDAIEDHPALHLQAALEKPFGDSFGGELKPDVAAEFFREMSEGNEVIQTAISKGGLLAKVMQAENTLRAQGKVLTAEGRAELVKLTEEAARVKISHDLETSLRGISISAELTSDNFASLATQLKVTEDRMAATKAAILALREEGIDPSDESIKRLTESFRTLQVTQKEQESSLKLYTDLTDVVKNTTLSFADSLVDMAATGKASWKDLAESAIKDINRIILKVLILKAIEIGTNYVSGLGGGGAEQLSGPGMAEGGIVKATPGGRLFRIGEGGQDEAVIPLDRLGQGGRGTQSLAIRDLDASLGVATHALASLTRAVDEASAYSAGDATRAGVPVRQYDAAAAVMSQVGGSSTGTMEVNVYAPPGSKVEQRDRRGADGRVIKDIVISTMKQAHASGEMDDVMAQSHGVNRPGVAR